MHLPRSRVRTLMVAVAAVGTVFGVARLIARALTFRAVVAYHAESEQTALQVASFGDSWIGPEAKFRGVASYHARMRLKYEWAARYPWLPVEPDPPPP